MVQDSSQRVGRIEGFAGPESVRYDPDQDVWFVSNMDGAGDVRDGNGFISRVSAESGEVETLRFARGTPERPLHSPRGMCLAGDTLWVADADGVHGFHYVTDTRKSSVYRIVGRNASLALADTVLGIPNGITWDPARGLLVLVPWLEGFRVNAWRPGAAPEAFGPTIALNRVDVWALPPR